MDKKINMRRFYKIITIQNASAIIFFFFLFLNNVYSQDFKLAGIQYVNYPKSEIKNDSGNQKTSFQEFGAFVNFPIKFKNDKSVLINGFGYGYVETTMYDYPLLQTREYQKKLQQFYYHLTFVHKWNEKWALLVNLKPTFASDFEQKLSSDDFVFQGSVIATKIIYDQFKIGAGFVSSTRWGSPKLVPVVNMHYKNNRHNLNAILPLSMKYTYALLPEEKLKLGVQYTRNGANFNISATDIPKSDMAEIDKINYSRANIGAHSSYQLTKILRLEASGGISAGRKYNLVDVDENVHDFSSKSSPYFNVGLVLVSPKKE